MRGRQINLGVHSPARFLVKFRREFNLETTRPGETVRLRVPVPFEDRTQREIDVRLVEPLEAGSVARMPGRLEVALAVPRDRDRVAVEVHVGLLALCESVDIEHGPQDPVWLSESEAALYTRPVDGFVRVTPAVAALAESLAGKERSDLGALRRIWRFFFERMRFGPIHLGELDPEDRLSDLVRGASCDCFTGSALLVGLCRARRLPARVVGGVWLAPDAPTTHFWAEVYVSPYGWFPVDLASWDLAAGDYEDTEWAHYYFGQMDHRMKTVCLPRAFVGRVGPLRARDEYILISGRGPTTNIEYWTLPTRFLYGDSIRVTEIR
jgi:transglutaminase-like putative cysteine protease